VDFEGSTNATAVGRGSNHPVWDDEELSFEVEAYFGQSEVKFTVIDRGIFLNTIVGTVSRVACGCCPASACRAGRLPRLTR
jgi:hypothetical protein